MHASTIILAIERNPQKWPVCYTFLQGQLNRTWTCCHWIAPYPGLKLIIWLFTVKHRIVWTKFHWKFVPQPIQYLTKVAGMLYVLARPIKSYMDILPLNHPLSRIKTDYLTIYGQASNCLNEIPLKICLGYWTQPTKVAGMLYVLARPIKSYMDMLPLNRPLSRIKTDYLTVYGQASNCLNEIPRRQTLLLENLLLNQFDI